MFRPFEEVAPPIRLPWLDHLYELPYPSFDDLKVLDTITDPKTEHPPADVLERILLGDAAAQMRTDHVPPGLISRAVMTALADVQAGRDAAEMMWQTGGAPAAVDAWVKAREAEAAAEQSSPVAAE